MVDAESDDETVALARARGAHVIVRPWAGFVATRTFARDCVRTPWTFMLDADESLDPVLARALADAAPDAYDAYRMKRTTLFCGRPMLHGGWGGETLLRLFRTERATLVAAPAAGGTAELHERWVVPGDVGFMPGTLVHDSYPTLEAYREKFARYTALEARGVRASRFTLLRAVALAALRAAWLTVGRGAWRDGWRGVFVALASAAYPVAVAWKARRP
ncbi:MAG: glycosyltransferase family 2 protein [Vulcanimicrobiaceae bacterium]